MELIRLSYATFRDLERELGPRLGLEGGWLPAKEDLAPGEVLAFEIGVGEGFPVLRGTATVLEADRQGSDVPVRFSALDRGSRVLLQRLVHRYEAAGGDPVELPGEVAVAVEASPAPVPVPAPEDEAGPLLVAELEGLLERQARAEGHAPGAVSRRLALHATQVVRSPPSLQAEPGRGVSAEPGAAAETRGARRFRISAPGLWLTAAGLVAVALAWSWVRAGGEGEPSPAVVPEGPASAAVEASIEAEPEPPAPAVASEVPPPGPSFSRLLAVRADERGSTTIVRLELDGRCSRERIRTERVTDGPPREIVKLAGVRALPSPARRTLGTAHVEGVRLGLHDDLPEGSLWVVADLSAPGVRLEGVEIGESNVDLVFVHR